MDQSHPIFFPSSLSMYLTFSKSPGSFRPQCLRMPLSPTTKKRSKEEVEEGNGHTFYILHFTLETLENPLQFSASFQYTKYISEGLFFIISQRNQYQKRKLFGRTIGCLIESKPCEGQKPGQLRAPQQEVSESSLQCSRQVAQASQVSLDTVQIKDRAMQQRKKKLQKLQRVCPSGGYGFFSEKGNCVGRPESACIVVDSSRGFISVH